MNMTYAISRPKYKQITNAAEIRFMIVYGMCHDGEQSKNYEYKAESWNLNAWRNKWIVDEFISRSDKYNRNV